MHTGQLVKTYENETEQLDPEDGFNFGVIGLGYLLAMIGGLFGVFIGIFLLISKSETKIPLFNYPVSGKVHGLLILIIGLMAMLFWLYINVNYFRIS